MNLLYDSNQLNKWRGKYTTNCSVKEKKLLKTRIYLLMINQMSPVLPTLIPARNRQKITIRVILCYWKKVIFYICTPIGYKINFLLPLLTFTKERWWYYAHWQRSHSMKLSNFRVRFLIRVCFLVLVSFFISMNSVFLTI